MTLTAGRHAAANPVSVGRRLAELVVAARRRGGPRPLLWATVAAPSTDPIDLFAVARSSGLEVALWCQPAAGRSIVGIGRAWAAEFAGPERFAATTSAWRAVLGDALETGSDGAGPVGPDTGPRLLGGLGFTGRAPAGDDPWAAFGPSSLVLPTFGLVQEGGSAALTVAIGPDETDPDPEVLEETWRDIVARVVSADVRPGPLSTRDPRATADPTEARIVDERPGRPAWDRTVGLFAGAVGRGRIDKVVLARRVVFRGRADLDVAAALRDLAATAPESTIFAFVRRGTTFLGATPERLVRTSDGSFETVAIAGTAARGRDAEDDARLAAALLASEKDREEHAVVVQALRSSLRPIARTLHVAGAPAILPLRHVQHLVTPITGTLHDKGGLLDLARELHPTPAVGGAPRDDALVLIDEHEGFDRGWYAGPIGWLGADGDGELMVALRCGLVNGPEATLFAGCGIVADSDPAREWDESRLKLRTMTAALGDRRGAWG